MALIPEKFTTRITNWAMLTRPLFCISLNNKRNFCVYASFFEAFLQVTAYSEVALFLTYLIDRKLCLSPSLCVSVHKRLHKRTPSPTLHKLHLGENPLTDKFKKKKKKKNRDASHCVTIEDTVASENRRSSSPPRR